MKSDELMTPPFDIYIGSIKAYIQRMFANPAIKWNQDASDLQSFANTNFAKVRSFRLILNAI